MGPLFHDFHFIFIFKSPLWWWAKWSLWYWPNHDSNENDDDDDDDDDDDNVKKNH